MTFIKYVKSDFSELYPKKNLKCVLSSLLNPSFHAAFLIRCAQFSPKFLFWFFRLLLISKHSIDFGRGCEIGLALRLPHPIGIVFGGGVKIGNNCIVYQNVTFGLHKEGYPTVLNKVIVYGNSLVVGPILIEDMVTIGALQFVSKSLANNTIYGSKK